jgi:trigger factor
MHSQVTDIDPVTIELQVEIPWDRVRRSLDEGFSKLRRSAHVKGFRPGKAPRSVLERFFGHGLREQVVSALVEESIRAAVEQHELPVVSEPKLEDAPEIVEGQPLSFKVKFEVRPKITELQTHLTLTRTSIHVTDADVDAEIERLREQHAIVRPVEENRPARKGDVLIVDYQVEVDGVPQPDRNHEDVSIELGDAALLPEIGEALLGSLVGETKEVRVHRQADDPNSKPTGANTLFRIKVKELREKILPDLDDEFAKDVGEYQTLLELRLAVRRRLEESAQARADDLLRQQVIEKLVDANPIPVPPSLVEQRMRVIALETRKFMAILGGHSPPIEDLRKLAERSVRWQLLVDEIARRESLTVSDEEVEARIREIAERFGHHLAKVRAEYSGERRHSLEEDLRRTKVVQFLLGRATFSEPPPVEHSATNAPGASA